MGQEEEAEQAYLDSLTYNPITPKPGCTWPNCCSAKGRRNRAA